jgi:tetratricopeptide (TPR) repeat protein
MDEASLATGPGELDRRAAALLRELHHTGDVSMILTAVGLLRAAVGAAPDDDPELGQYLSHLCVATRRLFEVTDQVDLETLRESLEAGRVSVVVTSEDHQWYARRLANYGDSLQRLYERTRDLDALRTALRIQQRAADLSEGRIRAIILMNVCMALRHLGDETGEAGHLHRAVAAGREGFGLLGAEDPEKAGLASNVGLALRALFQFTGDIVLLREAVAISRQAVDILPANHPYWPGRQHNFGLALRYMYEQTSDVAVLEDAVAAHRAALFATTPGHPSGAMYASALSGALHRMFQLRGDSENLNEAITVGRRAVEDSPADHRKLATRLLNLGVSLLTRYERQGAREDIDEAIELGRRMLDAAPPGHPDRSDALTYLCSALQRGAEATGDGTLITEAAQWAHAVVAETPPGHADRGMHLANLGTVLLAQYERSGEVEQLRAAMRTFRDAMAETPREHSRRPHRLLNMGHTLAQAFYTIGDADIGLQARNAFQQAAASALTTPAVRINAHRAVARLAAMTGDWAESSEQYAAAVALLPQTAARHRARADREHGIGESSGLAAEAAAAALSAGDPKRAAVLLEAGRGLILNEDLAARNWLTRLGDLSPDRADKLARLRILLNSPETDALDEPGAAARRQKLAAEWDDLLRQIQELPEMRGLLDTLTFDDLRAEATAGPIVVINIADHRTDALILTAGGVRVVELPDASLHTAQTWAEAFLNAVDAVPPRQDVITSTLIWLWDAVARPVLDAAGITGPPGSVWPRIWWCPTGPLAHLPLHAAGRHAEPGHASVLDRAISSYTPTVRALRHVRRPRAHEDCMAEEMLVVAMPHTPGAPNLPGARSESEMLTRLYPGTTRVLTGPQATHESVSAALATARWVHFACHGFMDMDKPSSGRLLLADHQQRPLTVADLARLGVDGPELAFLSACSTGRPAARLTDEAIHMASAFQLIGYLNVVSTLWPVSDRPAVRIARDIYTRLADTDTIGLAVHEAVRHFRSRWPEHPSLWAAYIHGGA